MSKGKRKSDLEALRIVRQRLRCRQARFTEQDRELLTKLCRVDLIYILEVNLSLGPLKASQKNSVASMVNFLLAQQAQANEASGPVACDVNRNDQAPMPGPCSAQQQELKDACQGVSPADSCAGLTQCPSSGGGSCHTPSTVQTDEQQPQQLGQMPSGTLPAAAVPGPYPDEPWLAELQQQLMAAGNIRNMEEDTTDRDDDTNGTEADSSWMPSQSGMPHDLDMPMCFHNQHEQHARKATAAAAAALDTTQIEEMLVHQLLLDIEAKPKSRRCRLPSSVDSIPQQDRQPPLLLQQKLLEVEQQQQMLKLQQQLRLQQEQQQQLLLLQQQQLWQQPVHRALNIEQVLEIELLQQLHSSERLQYVQLQQQQHQQDVVGGSPAAGVTSPDGAAVAVTGASPHAYAGMWQQQQSLQQQPLQQQVLLLEVPQQQQQQRPLQLEQPLLSQSPQQNASWPLSFAQLCTGTATGAGSGRSAAQGAAAAGLPLFGLSDTPLPQAVQGGSRPASRLSYDAGADSFTRKRDKLWMNLPAVKDESLPGATDAGELCVELSGPSTEQPTKRMSITLPGSTQVASLPTSFSGKLGAGTTERALPGAMAQYMQLSSYEEPNSLRWQQHQQQLLGGLPSAQQPQRQYHHQQQQQVQQGGREPLEPAGESHQGLGSRLKMLLRGKKAKARRSFTVGAGGSFSIGAATAAAATTRIPSADAVLAVRKASAGSFSQFLPHVPLAAVQQQQQQCGDAGAAAARCAGGSIQGSCLLQDSTPHAPLDRQWHSLFMPSTPCDPHTVAGTIGGLSWHADMSTGFAGAQMSGAAAAGMQQLPGRQPQLQGMGHPSMGQHTAAVAAPAALARPAELPAGANVLSGDGGFAQQLALLRATYASQLLDEEDDAVGGVADPAGAQGLHMPSPAMLAGDAGLLHSSTGAGVTTSALRQGQSPFGAGAAGLGLAEGALGSVRVDDMPGFVGRLTRALKLGSSRSSQNLTVLLPAAASTNMDGDEEDENLLITGRCDGELQLARAALQCQAGGEVSIQDFVAALHAGGLGSAGVKLEQGMQECSSGFVAGNGSG